MPEPRVFERCAASTPPPGAPSGATAALDAPLLDGANPLENTDPAAKDSPLEEVRRRLGQLTEQIAQLQRNMRLTIEKEIGQWAGRSYGSLSANQTVARLIHETVDGHGLRLRCPECGHPAILRCSARPGVPEGVFVFDHSIEGRRTFHGGGATLPSLRVVARPARRRTEGTSRSTENASRRGN